MGIEAYIQPLHGGDGIQHEAGAKLDETARQSLSQQIEEIEATFFRGKPVPASAPDLDAVARKWLQTVS